MANYSRFIRPGYKFIAIGDRNSLAAYDAASGTLVLVTTNGVDTATRVHYDLSSFTQLGASAELYRTSSTQDLAYLALLSVAGKQLTVALPARSVTTLVIKRTGYTGRSSIDYHDYYRLIAPDNTRAIGTNPDGIVIQEPLKGAPDQQWALFSVGDGYYKIINRQSGLALDVRQASKQSGASIQLYPYSDGQNQPWSLRQLKNGLFEIVARHSGLLLSSRQITSGSGLIQQNEQEEGGHQWKLVAAKP